MPWEVKGKCVYTKTGTRVKCHATTAQANRHMKALYANVKEGDKSFDEWHVWEHQVTPEVANYNPVGGNNKKACANCQWYDSPDGCMLVAGDISPTGISDFWHEQVKYAPEPISVMITNWGEKSVDKISKWINNLLSPTKETVQETNELKPVYYDENTNRAILIGSNNFQDRHDQIIPEVVQNEYIEWVNNNPQFMPDFQIWHLGDKSKWGKADHVFRAGNFTVASGPVDPGMEQFAKSLSNDPDTGVSNGWFGILSEDNKEFLGWWPYEFSALAAEDVANVWMNHEQKLIQEGYIMPISEGDKALLKAKGVPDAFITHLETSIDNRSTQVTNAGVGSKEVAPDVNTGVQQDDLLTSMATVISEKLTPFIARLDAIEAGQKSFEEKLSKTQAELVAEQIQAQVGAAAQHGFKASESDDNVVSTKNTDPMAWVGKQFDEILAAQGIKPNA